MSVKLMDLQFQQDAIGSQLREAIERVLSTTQYIGGPEVSSFEESFADYIGVSHCVGVGNGTDALELLLEAHKIGPGCDVILPAMSFAATLEAILRVGAQPVFVDVDDSGTLDLGLVQDAITPQTRAIVVVHLYGYPVNVRCLRSMLGDREILLLEDAAQAHGTKFEGEQAGSLGDGAAFSFYPGKNLGALGDAGAVCTNDSELAATIRRLANHGRLGKFDHELLGRNSRLDAIQAAVLNVKLPFLERWVSRRNEIAQRYLIEFQAHTRLVLPSVTESGRNSWHQFAIQVDERDSFREHMARNEVDTGVHYPIALPELPFVGSPKRPEAFPQAIQLARRTVSLPVAEHLTEREIEKVINAVCSY